MKKDTKVSHLGTNVADVCLEEIHECIFEGVDPPGPPVWGFSREGRASIRGVGKRTCPDLVMISGRYNISIDTYKTDISLRDPLLGIHVFSVSRCRRRISALKVY